MNNPDAELTQSELPLVSRRTKVPVKAYGYDIAGVFFNGSSIRGRSTPIYAVRTTDKPNKLMALKLSCQHARRININIEKEIQGLIKGKDIGVLASYSIIENYALSSQVNPLQRWRGCLPEKSTQFGLEERLLNAKLLELKRPICFFWSIQDFVMGVRGALLGHQWLVHQGILHSDVSENNIVLACVPWEGQRGYIIDFDNAIYYTKDANLDVAASVKKRQSRSERYRANRQATSNQKHYAELRTGTTPYMSINVLTNRNHRPSDDVESFFYVLLLFIFSYCRPQERQEQMLAATQGFTHTLGSGQPANLVVWPSKILKFSEGTYDDIAAAKTFMFNHSEKFLREAESGLVARWQNRDLVDTYYELLNECFDVFAIEQEPGQVLRRVVTHSEFVEVIDAWLASEDSSVPIDGFNQCPFKDEKTGKFAI
ncbi:hypothetical protein BJ138DRAFT_1142966 [Hygrophoropsis aurantiaca]|uniref:Uncharacterized protein n=1 Tax=Hygrophoropsis aurantiaca TaxID=72124 RepID=A0ACB8AQB9_9AGAM|nr:hypothetical protein BJ138DRAFT_1142966 [Hygrophoropsis aurantiaca]